MPEETAGIICYVDETYIKVQGRWCDLYGAIDRDGHLIDVWLSHTRDLAAAIRFSALLLVKGRLPPQSNALLHLAKP